MATRFLEVIETSYSAILIDPSVPRCTNSCNVRRCSIGSGIKSAQGFRWASFRILQDILRSRSQQGANWCVPPVRKPSRAKDPDYSPQSTEVYLALQIPVIQPPGRPEDREMQLSEVAEVTEMFEDEYALLVQYERHGALRTSIISCRCHWWMWSTLLHKPIYRLLESSWKDLCF